MPNLRVRPKAAHGLVTEVTPESAGWSYVGFALHRLNANEGVAASTGGREVCLVVVSGQARLSIDGRDFGVIGGRKTPFDGPPWAAYAPAGSRYSVTAITALELGVCSAPGGPGHPAKLIPPGAYPQIARGKGSNTRYVTNIMPEDDGSADALLVLEVALVGQVVSIMLVRGVGRRVAARRDYLDDQQRVGRAVVLRHDVGDITGV